VTGEIHAAASASPKRKEPSAFVKLEAVWLLRRPGYFGGKRNYLAFAGNPISTVFPTA